MTIADQRARPPAEFGETRGTVLLVVDDDMIQRRVISRIAAQAGHTVREAASVDEAAGLLAREAIDAITVDLSLGERSGAEILMDLAKSLRDVPVVIISGMPDIVLQSTTRCAEQSGLNVRATFSKPLDLGRLRQTLAEIREICAVRARFA